MPSPMEPVDLDFFERAPHRFTSTALIRQPPERVFAALHEDPAGWGAWYPGFSSRGRFLTAPPHGVGSRREVSMMGVRYVETILACDLPKRWAFRVDEASLPMGRALAEDYHLEGEGANTTLTWVFAIEPRGWLRPFLPAMGPFLQRLINRASTNLGRRLER